MFSANDVYNALISYSDTKDFTDEELLCCCTDGLNWVIRRLRSGVSEQNPLILETATAIAHYFFFIRRLSEPDKYENYKVGDLTVKQNVQKQFEMEKQLRQSAIANAAEILKDGGFFFCGR